MFPASSIFNIHRVIVAISTLLTFCANAYCHKPGWLASLNSLARDMPQDIEHMFCECAVFFAQQNELKRSTQRLDSTSFSTRRVLGPWSSLINQLLAVKTVVNILTDTYMLKSSVTTVMGFRFFSLFWGASMWCLVAIVLWAHQYRSYSVCLSVWTLLFSLYFPPPLPSWCSLSVPLPANLCSFLNHSFLPCSETLA